MQSIAAGEKIRIALRPENIALGKCDGSNAFNAAFSAAASGHPGRVYDIDLFGHRLECLNSHGGPASGRGRNPGFFAAGRLLGLS